MKYNASESTVRKFVKLWKRQQADTPDVDFIALYQKQSGRSKLLPEETDEIVINMIKSMGELGPISNYSIIISIAEGIVTVDDRTHLKENGGTIEFG